MRLADRLHSFCARPSSPALAALFGVFLLLPALFGGLQTDDLVHRLVMLGPPEGFPPVARSRLEMFSFVRGGLDEKLPAMDAGVMPWWTAPEMRAAFLRPLTALTHILDYELWPDAPALMHAQNLVWYGLLAFAVARFHRRILSPGNERVAGTPLASPAVAGLAGLIYAIDDAHAFPAGWIANRNAILATLLGVLALAAHDAWRRERRTGWGVAAPALLLAGLFAGEAALAATAYLFAYAAFLDRAPLARRFATLIPYAAAAIAWRWVYTATGHGAFHADHYIDPGAEPLRYAGELWLRVPALLAGQWAGPPADVVPALAPSAARVFAAVAAGAFLAVLVFVAPLVRRDPVARFLLAGSLLALPPACATFPMDRLLLFVGVGASGLLAMALAAWRRGDPAIPRAGFAGRLRRAVFPALVFMHLVAAPALAPIRASIPAASQAMQARILRLPEGMEIAGREFVAVSVPSHFMCVQPIPIELAWRGETLPSRVRTLVSGFQDVEVLREDDRTLVLTPSSGWLRRGGSPRADGTVAPADVSHLGQSLDRLFRMEASPMKPGERIEVGGTTAEILAVGEDGLPTRVRFRFAEALESPRYVWAAWGPKGYEAFALPAIGETKTIPRAPLAPKD